jgi:hypothetical protein
MKHIPLDGIVVLRVQMRHKLEYQRPGIDCGEALADWIRRPRSLLLSITSEI